MMGQIKSMLLIGLLLLIHVSCNSGNPGCTDPQALNYDPSSMEEDDSCVYEVVTINPEWSIELSDQLRETSGLILWGGDLWTLNDDTDPRLYRLDTLTGEIRESIYLWRVVNRDWEEISQDEDFIYVGDFGNNNGTREDLHILRISKRSLLSGHPSVDSIRFTYSDQTDFSNPGFNQTEFDCEAFVVSSDSIYLFTKQWKSGYTTQYVVPKAPGSYVAKKRASFDTQGQVTGANYLEQERILVLCGYSGLMQPFLYLFYEYDGDDFFSGIQKRVNIALLFHQIEGVASVDGIKYYLSNEHVAEQSYINIPQKLHLVDLGEILSR
ncbi:MAG: T9SS C-terminal target domain-containing protein [Bacteroidota bacterium]|nr:T9SS C-terminal target domain-containing protein [Bacteroidota bacterium]